MTITKKNRKEYLNLQTSAYKLGWESCEKGNTHKKISTDKGVQADFDTGYGSCWANTESLNNGVFN
jgi:hypothetical protein